MPHTFASLLVHVVFSTKDRAPELSGELPGRLFPYMSGIVRELKGAALIVNGPADHMHLLLSIPAALSVADLLRVEFLALLRKHGLRCDEGAWA